MPLPKSPSNADEETPEILSNMLVSVLPDVKNAMPVAVTVSEMHWAEVHWNCHETEQNESGENQQKNGEDEDGDVFAYESDDSSKKQPGDWTGTERDRRSAFSIVGALRPEGMLST